MSRSIDAGIHLWYVSRGARCSQAGGRCRSIRWHGPDARGVVWHLTTDAVGSSAHGHGKLPRVGGGGVVGGYPAEHEQQVGVAGHIAYVGNVGGTVSRQIFL